MSPSRTARITFAALSCLLQAVTAPSLQAQRHQADSSFALASPSAAAPVPSPEATFRPPVGRGILGGTLGSAVGLVGGAVAGYAVRSCSSGEWFCGAGEAALGAMVGSVVGSTLGANIGARRGGASPTFGSTALGGTLGLLSGLAGAYLMAGMAPEGPAPLVGFALGQGVVTGLFAAHHR